MSSYFDEAQVVSKTGTPNVFERRSDKDRGLAFRFCPNCGTTVWWTAEFLPGKVGIAAGLFEDYEFAPDGAYFCATKPDFALLPEGLKQLPAGSSR